MRIDDAAEILHYETEEIRVKERVRLLEQACHSLENVIAHCNIYKTDIGPFGLMFQTALDHLTLADTEYDSLRRLNDGHR